MFGHVRCSLYWLLDTDISMTPDSKQSFISINRKKHERVLVFSNISPLYPEARRF